MPSLPVLKFLSPSFDLVFIWTILMNISIKMVLINPILTQSGDLQGRNGEGQEGNQHLFIETVRVLEYKQILTNPSTLLGDYQLLRESREFWRAGSEHAEAESLVAQMQSEPCGKKCPISMRHCCHHFSSLLCQTSWPHQLCQEKCDPAPVHY